MARGQTVAPKTDIALIQINAISLTVERSAILNWVGVAGAVEHLDLNWFEYVPGYRSPAGTGTGLSFATWA